MTAGYYLVITNFDQGKYLLVGLAVSLTVLMAIVFTLAFRKWYQLAQEQPKATEKLVPTTS